MERMLKHGTKGNLEKFFAKYENITTDDFRSFLRHRDDQVAIEAWQMGLDQLEKEADTCTFSTSESNLSDLRSSFSLSTTASSSSSSSSSIVSSSSSFGTQLPKDSPLCSSSFEVRIDMRTDSKQRPQSSSFSSSSK